jgi:cation-dependent mannose-6-phosphate receptor
MWFPSFFSTLVLMLALRGGNTAASDDKLKPVLDPCTISSSSGSFFDLRPLSIHSLPEGKKPAKNQKVDGWHAKGYDYKANFTLNICEPVVEKLVNVQGVEKSRWKNISAFYEVGSKQFSLGQVGLGQLTPQSSSADMFQLDNSRPT